MWCSLTIAGFQVREIVLTGRGAFDRRHIAMVTPTIIRTQATTTHVMEESRCKTAATTNATTGMSTRLRDAICEEIRLSARYQATNANPVATIKLSAIGQASIGN